MDCPGNLLEEGWELIDSPERLRNQVWKWAETNKVLEGWAEGPTGEEEMTVADWLPISGQA